MVRSFVRTYGTHLVVVLRNTGATPAVHPVVFAAPYAAHGGTPQTVERSLAMLAHDSVAQALAQGITRVTRLTV